MVKKLGIALLCTALGSTLYARGDISTSSLFIGLELESTKVDSSTELFLSDDFTSASLGEFGDTSSSVIEYGVRLGAEKDDWRTTLLYTYYNDENEGLEETMHKGSILLDYFIWSSGSGDYTVKPYIGGHVGYMSYKASGDLAGYGIDQIYADESGLFYGGQAGIALTISKVVQLDLSYKYSLTNIDNITDSAYLGNTGGNPLWLDSVQSLDNMGSIAFSINYFY